MKYAFCVAAAAIFNVGSAHAEVVNISALAGANPVSIDLGGGATGVGETLDLTVGTYTVTPVNSTFGGATFDAANRFGYVDMPAKGWDWDYFYQIGSTTAVQVGNGATGGIGNPAYRASAADAFASAPAPVKFTLTADTPVTFYWVDDYFGDNIGGISIDVASTVPEPGSFAAMLAGLATFCAVSRRRQKN